MNRKQQVRLAAAIEKSENERVRDQIGDRCECESTVCDAPHDGQCWQPRGDARTIYGTRLCVACARNLPARFLEQPPAPMDPAALDSNPDAFDIPALVRAVKVRDDSIASLRFVIGELRVKVADLERVIQSAADDAAAADVRADLAFDADREDRVFGRHR